MSQLQQHELLFELVNDSVMIRSMEGRIDFWNHSAEELYGWRKDEAIGRVSHNLLQTEFPKPLEEIESELVRNGRWEGKLVHTTRDGGRVVVESRWSLDLKGQFGAVVEINARATIREIDPEAGTDTYSVETGRQEPVPTSKLMKADDLLPKIANIVLAAAGASSFLALLYFLYYYNFAEQRMLTSWTGMALYYAVPLFLSACFFAATRLEGLHKVKIAIFSISLIISVYAAELFLRHSGALLTGPRAPIWAIAGGASGERRKEAAKLAKSFGVDFFDTRSRLEVVLDLRSQGIAAVPLVTPEILREREPASVTSPIKIDGVEVLPFGGIANIVTVLCNESGEYVSYESDEHGFNNPRGTWSSGSLKIAILGDSFAHGFCVAPDKTFMGLIRDHHPATLSLGMAGNGPLLELAGLKEYLADLTPQIVLWFYFEGNDLSELQVERTNPLLMRYLEKDFRQGLLHRQDKIDQALIDYVEREMAAKVAKRATKSNDRRRNDLLDVMKLSTLRQKLGLVYGTTLEKQQMSDFEGANMDLLREILSQAKTLVDTWDGRLYFVYLPDWHRYVDCCSISEKQRERVLALVGDLGIPIIDLHPAFEKQPDLLSLFPFRGAGHYNEKGQRLVAQEVLKSIADSR